MKEFTDLQTEKMEKSLASGDVEKVATDVTVATSNIIGIKVRTYTEQNKLRKSQKTMQQKNTKANNYSFFIYSFRYMSSVEIHVYFKLLAPTPLL